MPQFLLDTNFFIEAHRKSYPMDVFPSFWERIQELVNAEILVSIDKVKGEIFKNEDELKIWCIEKLSNAFFQNSDEAIAEYKQIITWAYSKRNNPYTQSALDVFMNADEADAWLVAYALKNHLSLVTFEVSSPESKKSIKLPDACIPFGVQCLQPMDMFRVLGVKM
jgi:hypothetical protein